MEEENLIKNSEDNISKEEFLKLKRDNSRNKAIILVLCFAMLLMMILIILYFINGNKEEPKGVQPNNGGQVENTPAPSSEPTPTTVPTPTPTPPSSNITKKLVKLDSSTCDNYTETFNNIKVEAIVNTEYYECGHQVLVNGKSITTAMIGSIEFYDNYVIIEAADTGNSFIQIIDTRDMEREYETRVEGYSLPSYISDDEGLLLTVQYYGAVTATYPGSNYAKVRIKYENGYFGDPEIIEKYN